MRSLSEVRACLRASDIWPHLPGWSTEESSSNCQAAAMRCQSVDDLSPDSVKVGRLPIGRVAKRFFLRKTQGGWSALDPLKPLGWGCLSLASFLPSLLP